MNGTSTKSSCRLLVVDQFQAKKTEIEIVKNDAMINEKFEIKYTRRRRMVGVAEQKKDIHADVYGEILSYLPARKLQTLIIVCKDWLQLITSSDFVRLHISRANRGHIRVLITNRYSCIRGFLEYNSYYKETIQQIPFPVQYSWYTKILGSADGLTFLLNKVSRLTSIFNPSTGKCFRVQLFPTFLRKSHHLKFYWFGKIGGTEEYILVMGVYICETIKGQLEIWVYKFSRSSNIINRICSTQVQARGMPIPIYDGMRGTFVQGVIHWPFYRCTDNRCAILAYDLGKNEFREISSPAECNRYSVRLGLFLDGCSLLATCHTSIWIMKDGRWTKYAKVEVSTDKSYGKLLDPLGFFPNGDLIMEVNISQLMRYSFTHKEATLLMEYGWCSDGAIVCADSLLSPGC